MAERASSNPMQNQINLLKESMDRGISEIKAMLIGMDTRMRQIETSEARCFPVIDARVGEVERDVKDHTADLKELRAITARLDTAIEKQMAFNKVVSWAGGLIGSAVVVWIVGQVLGLIK